MESFDSLILGLGLFFLGLRLIGQNLSELGGGGFRDAVRFVTHTPPLASVLGIMSGALTQSATAVTFILASMLGSGLIKPPAARLVVVWSNVGLTALAFLAMVDIHPLVAYFVGGTGIALGSVRAKPWSTVAGVLLGVGLLLFALENMGAGAAPLKNEPWFRQGLEAALASPWFAFACGFGAAALLQSNAGASMLVITLCEAGSIPASAALPMIYGTNLGAIPLRGMLALGMKGDAIRLVRTEDLFCLASGLLMMALFFGESLGMPLVGALSAHLTVSSSGQLAVAFLLSNLLPALALSPLLPACARLLDRFWPPGPEKPRGEAAFLSSHALVDPPTALDLLAKELGRLLGSLRVEPRRSKEGALPADTDPEALLEPEFVRLAFAIDTFCMKLALRDGLGPVETARLQWFRAALGIVRHIAEAAAEFSCHLGGLPEPVASVADPLRVRLERLLAIASGAVSSPNEGAIAEFHAQTRRHGQPIMALREAFSAELAALKIEQRMKAGALDTDFELCVWLLHRLAKLLPCLAASSAARVASG
ncbi:Na/Pi symporter [Methylococcus geothermalis]|uniref:Na/Pi cotransporter family protein n=1 Tax=Methylococcus geothermalis TaxID=2681310 RepID=A0A858Q557_9GAMM|nr:Na/Pi symporter [Methylococcus geothermalis]QJD28980.1 Na/Pi cotransporter family protein [Methylococcus geothermalis]